MTLRWMRPLALFILSAAVAFWLWFGIASAMGEKLGAVNWIAHLIVPGGILLASLLVAWRWAAPGGILLVLEGLLVGIGYPVLVWGRFPLFTIVMMFLVLSLPLLLAGGLLLLDWREAVRPAP